MAEDEPKVTASRPVDPIVVAVIGTGDGRGLPSGTEAITPGLHAPNIIVRVVSPAKAIAIRFANNYIGALVGSLGIVPLVIPVTSFADVLIKSASLAVGGAIVLLLKDVMTVLSGLEKSHPLSTGNV